MAHPDSSHHVEHPSQGLDVGPPPESLAPCSAVPGPARGFALAATSAPPLVAPPSVVDWTVPSSVQPPDASPSEAPAWGKAGADAATPDGAPGPSILIVENEESNRMLMEKILTFAGYRCVIACNGREAVDLFDREHPDLILTDVSMPVMDGYEATATIRARPDGGRVPIVAVTAHAMIGDREQAIQQGCTDYLAKPYRPRALLDVVERLLYGGSA